MIILLWTTWALAAVPDSLRPVVAPADAEAQYDRWADQTGRAPGDLACRELWPDEALICFQVTRGDTRRWVTEADLARWELDVEALERAVLARGRSVLAERPARRQVEGMQGTYWSSAEGDGWDALGLLDPERLAERMGGAPILVAAPVQDALLAWRPGDADLDKVMSVGARRMYEEQPGGVTPVVHRWTGEAWEAFGEAVPATDEASSDDETPDE